MRMRTQVIGRAAISLLLLHSMPSPAQTAGGTGTQAQHDGAHDFDFLIGDWKAHVKRLPDRLIGSTRWIEYDGISRHKKILGSNANFEEFEVDSAAEHLHIKAQTLRLYNPESHQWSIYLVDVDDRHLTGVGTNGAVFLAGRRQDVGSQLDL